MIYWNSPSIPDITDIEKETFYGIASGKGYREIARERNVSEVTVRATCERVKNRLFLANNLSVLRELVLRWILLFPFCTANEIILTEKQKNALLFISGWFKQNESTKYLWISTSGLKDILWRIREKYGVNSNESALVEAILRWDITKDDFFSLRRESIT